MITQGIVGRIEIRDPGRSVHRQAETGSKATTKNTKITKITKDKISDLCGLGLLGGCLSFVLLVVALSLVVLVVALS
jgi:hypothetical protein